MILPDACPHCKVSLTGELIKDEERAMMGVEVNNWSRVQLVVENKVAKAFKCPDCQFEWAIPWLRKEPKAQDLE